MVCFPLPRVFHPSLLLSDLHRKSKDPSTLSLHRCHPISTDKESKVLGGGGKLLLFGTERLAKGALITKSKMLALFSLIQRPR